MTSVPSVNDDVAETFRTNCVGFAAFSILIWDHVDTFATEVECIWKQEKGIVVYLFFLNRYLTPLGFIVNLFAYLSPVWTNQRYEILVVLCHHFIRFEGAMTLIGIHVVGIMMLLRINALYSTNRLLVAFVLGLWLVMFGVNAWLLTRGQPVIHNPQSGVRACTMIFPPQLSTIASSSAWLPLLYDSVILVLTLMKTLPLLKKGSGTYMIKRLLEDGLIYYTAICSVTLVLTIMIISAPPGLKNIAAQVELLVTFSVAGADYALIFSPEKLAFDAVINGVVALWISKDKRDTPALQHLDGVHQPLAVVT
ncbi:hypothetical protein MSAN_01345500 [Mycena sanguinolenta]|uniref:DUF6533 domain-containing protein n=1 Tax=Mycena sanguinolenta TaxID=230812 RepID=A0A8H7D3L0_9AGAR|nr:hypothetical protein MSAN_01345500 [Mycena sanguinolenta]